MGRHCATCTCTSQLQARRNGTLVVVGPSTHAIEQWVLSPASDEALLNRTVITVNAQRDDGTVKLRGCILGPDDDVLWLEGAHVAPHAAAVVHELSTCRRPVAP